MIRLAGMEVLVWMLRVSAVLTVLAAAATVLLCGLAHRRWRSSRPARWPHRVAFGGAVWGVLWAVLNAGGLSRLLAVAPLVLCAAGFAYIVEGNRRRGHRNPRLIVPAVSSAALGVAALLLLGLGMRAYHEAVAAGEAARRAEGRRGQDEFQAISLAGDDTIAIVGTTSSEPNDADDVWLLTVGTDGALRKAATFQRPGDQIGLTLAPGPAGSWMLGGKDDDHPFVARAGPEAITLHHRWDMPGVLSALHAVGDGRFLAGGLGPGGAWIGAVGLSGAELWSAPLDTGMAQAQVSAVAVAGERFLAVGSDAILNRGAFLAGGTLDGRVEWTRTFGRDSQDTTALTHVSALPDGTFLALGQRSRAGALEDLWLLHVSPDGAMLKDLTLGGEPGESAGGLAVNGDDVILAAHRFTGTGAQLWLQSVDIHGSVKWERTYPDAGFGRASGLSVLPGGDVLVVGHRIRGSRRDAWVARFDGNGTPVWQRTYPPEARFAPSRTGADGRDARVRSAPRHS